MAHQRHSEIMHFSGTFSQTVKHRSKLYSMYFFFLHYDEFLSPEGKVIFLKDLNNMLIFPSDSPWLNYPWIWSIYWWNDTWHYPVLYGNISSTWGENKGGYSWYCRCVAGSSIYLRTNLIYACFMLTDFSTERPLWHNRNICTIGRTLEFTVLLWSVEFGWWSVCLVGKFGCFGLGFLSSLCRMTKGDIISLLIKYSSFAWTFI